MRALTTLTTTELRLFLRDPASSFFALGLPLALLLTMGALSPGGSGPGAQLRSVFPPMVMSLVLGLIGFTLVSTVLATYREKGVLRRLGTTPTPPVRVLVAQLIVNAVMAMVAAVIVIVVGKVVFDWALPAHLLSMIVTLTLSVLALFAVGLFIAAIAPTGNAATGFGVTLLLPSLFFGGVTIPQEALPPAVAQVSEYVPLGAVSSALHGAWAGSWPGLTPLIVLLATAVVFGVAAAKLFRWE